MNDPVLWYLLIMPTLVVVGALVFSRWSINSIERDYRRSVRQLVITLGELGDTMQTRIQSAQSKEITTPFGVARATRLLAGARECIAQAQSAIDQDPNSKASWSTASRELEIARKMLNHIPVALADDSPGALDMPEDEPKPAVLPD